LWFITIDDLEAIYRLFDRHRVEAQQRLDGASDLLVLLGDTPEELLDGSLLTIGVIAELQHLLLQSVETESKVINILTWLEGQVLPLLAKCLQRGLAGAVAADACRSDGVPDLLDSPLLGKRELHLGRDCSNEGIQCPSILVVVDVVISNWFPHVPHLESYPHHRCLLDVVGLGEGRPPAAGTDVPDNGLDPMVIMVTVWGGRVTLPIKAAISVNNVVCSHTASLVSLSLLSLSSSAETELPVLLSRRASSSAIAARVASAAAAASTSALAAACSVIASLATLAAVAAVSAATRSRSSVAATLASCRCCALEAIER
jgi:hypothetical protein